MKIAIITGASSGIGLECAKKLNILNFKVFGIARDFSKCNYSHKNFIPIATDLTETKEINSLEEKLKKESISVLINSAGVGYFAPHEELSIEQIQKIISTNLTAPLLLSKIFLRSLKKSNGYIFNINSISGVEPALFGAAYGASKAGLIHFGTSLFKEARKSGLKVVNINPDITNTPFFEKLHFKPSLDANSFIDPRDIANVIESVLKQRDGTVITDIKIQPQLFKIEKKKRD
jgi:short-subunit dehydrogenase